MSESGLPSWRDSSARRAIETFITSVTTGPDAVPEEDRIAVFDNDGTLWTEKPMPTQLHYVVQQWTAAVKADPSLADQQPFKAVVEGDLGWLGRAVDKHYEGDDTDLHTMIGGIVKVTAGLSVEEYADSVAEFYRSSQHLTLNRPYAYAVYQPM
ncbi:MAG TPA: haloacid dehalogenase-like hydrolase, partial [Humibacter sp.]|nr:haloacid dehalogenase-like hydrolase [Humibacter sp.]